MTHYNEDNDRNRRARSDNGERREPVNNLPERVDEIDLEGTRVTRAAFEQVTSNYQPPRRKRSKQTGKVEFGLNAGCFLRGVILSAMFAVVFGLCGISILLIQYYSIARTLPEIGDLRERASQFETTRILDRNGNVLYQINDPNAGTRNYIPLKDISPNLIAATIATEDQGFYTNPGFDPIAIVRALWKNYATDGQGGGASTITQQLARALLLSPDERTQRTVARKTREIILAAEITRRYTKDEILELYLNEIYYGNLAYGIEAAAETYFGKSAKELSIGEAAFLAGLPQSPAIYDIYTNRDATLIRQQQVLVLMFEQSAEQNCIKVNNNEVAVCVDAVIATQAADEMKTYAYRAPSFDSTYPHWVAYVREQLETQYDAQTIYRSGFVVYTTLDPILQDKAQELVTNQVAAMIDSQAHNGALVAIQPSTGEILAMVGSPDFNNVAIAGQINMAVSPTRQPGSSIKPITYVAAFEKGWTPSTLIWDVPTQFPDGANPPYEPRNYDGKFRGPMTMRIALSNSFNIPAVKALEFVGIYDNPDTPEKEGMIAMAQRLGINSLTRDDYGLSLTLGGGDVSLLDMTAAYSVFANGGKKNPPVAILKITDYAGNIVYERPPAPNEQVIRAEHAYLISSILSDNNARSLMFGPNSPLNLTFPVAAKTGTTNDIRDNWTMGYTPDLVTGVWIGNADYTPMVNSSGLSGAAPIWSQFMEFAAPRVANGTPTPFIRPDGIVDKIVCKLSGTEPSNWCDDEYSEVFAFDQPPLPHGHDLARRVNIDLWSGFEASEACKGPSEEEMVMNVDDKWARDWLESNAGRDWLEAHGLPAHPYYAPDRECTADDPQPIIELQLEDGQIVTAQTLNIKGTAAANEGFKSWRLEFGKGAEPDSWSILSEANEQVTDDNLYKWDLSALDNGIVTVRLILIGEKAEVEKRVSLNINIPAPNTATPTETLTPTPTETLAPVPPTDTPTPTETPTETPTLTPIP